MLLLIDNYDSFTYNLVQCYQSLGQNVTVYRNDMITVDEIPALNPDHIVLSAGPCTPNEAGICVELLEKLGDKYPIFGVCLGMQSIGVAFGGEIRKAKTLMHGKTCPIKHDGKGVFAGLDNPVIMTRYNSLVIDRDSLPDCLTVTAFDDDNEIMGIRHKVLPIEGVQFHPESILSNQGMVLMDNFLKQHPIKK